MGLAAWELVRLLRPLLPRRVTAWGESNKDSGPAAKSRRTFFCVRRGTPPGGWLGGARMSERGSPALREAKQAPPSLPVRHEAAAGFPRAAAPAENGRCQSCFAIWKATQMTRARFLCRATRTFTWPEGCGPVARGLGFPWHDWFMPHRGNKAGRDPWPQGSTGDRGGARADVPFIPRHRAQGAGGESKRVVDPGGTPCSVTGPDGQRTLTVAGGLESAYPKKQAGVDWL